MKHLKITAVLLSTALTLALSSCANHHYDLETPDVCERIDQADVCKGFGNSLKGLAGEIAKDKDLIDGVTVYVQTRATRSEMNLADEVSEKIATLVSPVAVDADRLLRSIGVIDVDQLSPEEKLVTATLLYAEYMDLQNGDVLRGGAISDNEYINCAMSALGISEVGRMISGGIGKYVEKYGAKVLLKTIAKAAGRTISWVGYGLAMYDFVTCLIDIE